MFSLFPFPPSVLLSELYQREAILPSLLVPFEISPSPHFLRLWSENDRMTANMSYSMEAAQGVEKRQRFVGCLRQERHGKQRHPRSLAHKCTSLPRKNLHPQLAWGVAHRVNTTAAQTWGCRNPFPNATSWHLGMKRGSVAGYLFAEKTLRSDRQCRSGCHKELHGDFSEKQRLSIREIVGGTFYS